MTLPGPVSREIASVTRLAPRPPAQPARSPGAVDHVRAVLEHAGPVVDVTLIDSKPLDATRLDRYARTGPAPVPTDLEGIRALEVVRVQADLLRTGRHLGHHPRKLGKALPSVVAGQC